MSTTTASSEASTYQCSFCGKHEREVKKLIAGPGVYICDECVDLCDQILADGLPELRRMEELSEDALLAEMARVHASHEQVDGAVASIVRRLRDRSVSWARIGERLGMTRQSAWERYSGED